MSHNLGRVVPDVNIVIADVHDFDPVGAPRFVMLHFDNVSLSGSERLEVELGYGIDRFTAASGPDVWTRPINPSLRPIRIRVTGGSARLKEYGLAEETVTGTPGEPSGSRTNPDPFLQTNPYNEPIYETRLECTDGFAWQNATCAPAGSAQETVAASVGIVFFVRDGHVKSCSGTLIAGDLFLTSRHCFIKSSGNDVRSASVTFDYQTLCIPEGGRPDPHSPMFFKVIADVISGEAPIDARPPLAKDWVVLRLDGAPGALPPPLPMRDTASMGPEAVFTMHHPNGAVKKTQIGSWDGFGSVTAFDFAGGSSGSALFDGFGNVLRGPLSRGSGCSVSFVPITTVIDALENPPAPPSPLDVMVVFDKSGSMRSTAPPIGRTKLEEAQDAASLFISLVRAGSGDRLGLVTFNANAVVDPHPGPVADVRGSLVGGSPFNTGIVGDILSGGSTGLGRGVETALAAMGTASGNRRVILLLSDGMQNRDPLIQTVESSLGDTRLCVIGFGSDADIDGPLLNSIARDHAGRFTRAVDGLSLRKFFGICFGDIFESGALMDPNHILQASDATSADIPFSVCGEERITVILGWDKKGTPLRAHIRTPDGHLIAAGDGVEEVRGLTWAFWRIELPFEDERDGTWNIAVDRIPTSDEFPPDVEFFVSVVTAGGPSLIPLDGPKRVYTGDVLRPMVALHYPNRTAPDATVNLIIDAPATALGALVTEHGLVEPTSSDDSLSAFHTALQSIAAASGGLPVPRKEHIVELLDDGDHDDGAMEPDGIYGNILDGITRVEGTYEFRAIASYGEDCAATREAFWSIHVEPGIDPDKTDVELTDVTRGDDGNLSGVLVITPRDVNGNPLGPGRGDRFTATPLPGVVVGGRPIDNGDGSYGVDVAWDDTVTPTPGVVVNQPDRDPVVAQPDGFPPVTGRGCPLWLCWLLGLTALFLLIVVLAKNG